MNEEEKKGLKCSVINAIALIIAFPILFFIGYNSLERLNIVKAVDFNYDAIMLIEEAPEIEFTEDDDVLPERLLKGPARDAIVNSRGNLQIKADKVFELLNQDPQEYGKIIIDFSKRTIHSESVPEYDGQSGFYFHFTFYGNDQKQCQLKELEYIVFEEENEEDKVVIVDRKKIIYKDIELLENRNDITIYAYDTSPHALWTRYENDNGEIIRIKSGIEKISGWDAIIRGM